MGRRSKYTPDMVSRAFAAAQNHATDKDIAKSLGISVDSLARYQRDFADFADAIKRGGAISDDVAEESLFKRVKGYEYEEVETILELDPKTGESKPIKVRKIKKHVPPDTTADIIWLKHRRKKQWGDRQQERDPDEDAKIEALIKSMEAAARAGLQQTTVPDDPGGQS